MINKHAKKCAASHMIKYMQIKITTKPLFRLSAAQSCFFATPWTVASQAPPFMEFAMQEYWSGLPFPSPGDLLYPGIKPRSPTLQAGALTSEPPGKPVKEVEGLFGERDCRVQNIRSADSHVSA